MKEPLIGINYFAGWWEPLPNKWNRHKSAFDIKQGEDWRAEFPERVPLLGCFNDQDTMNREIETASSHRVNFFPILWYYNGKDTEREPNSRFLNNGIKNFMSSSNSAKMEFFIEFCNHPPFEVSTEQQWQECLEAWSDVFKHSSYMKVDGKLVFKIHGAQHLIDQNNGNIDSCLNCIESLRECGRKATGLEIIIGGGVMALDKIEASNPISKIFDFTCTYMDIPPYPQKNTDYPFEMLADLSRAARLIHCNDSIPYMPYLPAGWNPRPWPDDRAYFELPDKHQWSNALRSMKEDIENLPNLGLPMKNGTIQPAFICYAWNEFGEGGFIAPMQQEGFMKLESIQQIFAALPNEQRDTLENTFERRN